MLKSYGVIQRISREIGDAADKAASLILGEFDDDLKGREEDISSKLSGEITHHLLDNIQLRLNEIAIKGCNVSVTTFKKSQEKLVGADIAGVIEIVYKNRILSKTFLAQSKIGVNFTDRHREVYARANSYNLLKQVDDMLKITSDSFVFIYTKAGIFCLPALQIQLAGSSSVSTQQHPYKTFASFFEEFFKCFIGDHLISPLALNSKNLQDYAEQLKAEAILRIQVVLDEVNE